MVGVGCKSLGRVLVTGASGFIGQALLQHLYTQGLALRVIQHRSAGSWPSAVEVVQADVQQPDSLVRACQGIDTVFHLAGYAHALGNTPQQVQQHWQINALGSCHLLAAAKQAGVQRLVFLSSIKAAADGGARCVSEDDNAPPTTAYGLAKRHAEQAILAAANQLHTVCLRPCLVYGPGVKGNLASLLTMIRRGWFPGLPSVANRRSLVDVRDVVQALCLAALQPQARGQLYIVSDGREYSSAEIVALMRQALGYAPQRWKLPLWAWHTLAQLGEGARRVTGRSIGFDRARLDSLLGWACYDSRRIQQQLGFTAQWDLERALPGMIAASC